MLSLDALDLRIKNVEHRTRNQEELTPKQYITQLHVRAVSLHTRSQSLGMKLPGPTPAIREDADLLTDYVNKTLTHIENFLDRRDAQAEKENSNEV